MIEANELAVAKVIAYLLLVDIFIRPGWSRKNILDMAGADSDFFCVYEGLVRYIRCDDTTQTYRLTAKGRWYVLKNIINDGRWRHILRKNGLWNFIKMIFGLK